MHTLRNLLTYLGVACMQHGLLEGQFAVHHGTMRKLKYHGGGKSGHGSPSVADLGGGGQGGPWPPKLVLKKKILHVYYGDRGRKCLGYAVKNK